MEYGHAVPYPQYTEGPTGQPQAVCAWQRRTSWQVMTFKRFVGGATQKRGKQRVPLTADQPSSVQEIGNAKIFKEIVCRRCAESQEDNKGMWAKLPDYSHPGLS